MRTKLVHLSDLHLGYKGKKDKTPNVPEEHQQQVLEMVLQEEPDAVIVSGDLVKSPSEDNFLLVMEFLDKVKKTCPVLCVPGNSDYHLTVHTDDNGYPDAEFLMGGEEKVQLKTLHAFEKPWQIQRESVPHLFELPLTFEWEGDYWGLWVQCEERVARVVGDLETYIQAIGEPESVLQVNNVNLIGCDSFRDIGIRLIGKMETNLPYDVFMGKHMDGRIARVHLEERLKGMQPGISIAVMHHPILPIGGATKKYGRFDDADWVAKRLIRDDIQLALCGHKHIQGHVSEKTGFEFGETLGLNLYRDFHVCAAGPLFSKDIKKPYDDNSYNTVVIDGDDVIVYYQETNTGKREQLASFRLNEPFI
jgi:predicted phosphodiesterase